MHGPALAIDPERSTGSVVALERDGSAWAAADVPLGFEGGALTLAGDGAGELAMSALTISLADIALPMFPDHTRLTALTLHTAAPIPLAITWQADDEASARTQVALALDWSLASDRGVVPLGSQSLAPMPMSLSLASSSSGDGVTATVALDGRGHDWSWADLVAVDDLALALTASRED